MLECGAQRHQRSQALDGESVSLPGGRSIGPGDRQRHPPARATLADEHPLDPRAVLLEDDGQTLAEERVERVGDDDRFRKRARLGKTGAMRARSGSRAGV